MNDWDLGTWCVILGTILYLTNLWELYHMVLHLPPPLPKYILQSA